MKKLIFLTLFLAAYYGDIIAQSIQYKQTSIVITCDGGFSTNDNTIRYNITSDLEDAYLLKELFPDKQFNLINNVEIYSSTVPVNNMWQLIKMIKFEQSDVDRYVYDGIVKWSTNIIWDMNLLNINKADWAVKN